jgi:hypothetical protein
MKGAVRMYRTAVFAILVAAMVAGVAACPAGEASCIDVDRRTGDVRASSDNHESVWTLPLFGFSFQSLSSCVWHLRVVYVGKSNSFETETDVDKPVTVQTPPGRNPKRSDHPLKYDFTWDENKK